ncbi:RNA polymerase sigma factor [Nocardioides jensenii]|uniref:RNA polymerase sigma factor n=1 Tax=Nocardioides jensenii TaxID=1843 RepID=UPI000B2B22DD|nr:RNA polymerase sigma factor [Nocardioides jensenii]
MVTFGGIDMTELSDGELVDELRRGEGSSLGILFDRYADRIYNHCFRRTASWDTAQDATSTVFLEAWRGRERVVLHEDSALPWLYGIATNVCRNLTRKQRRHLAAVARLHGESDTPDHAEAVADRLDDERRMAAVLAAHDALPRRDQDVLSLVVWSGLSYEQAAVALGIPVGTVRSRLSRARRRLSAAVSEQEFHDD